MRVLQVIGSLAKGGAELQCRLLAENLPRLGYVSGILYLHEGTEANLLKNVQRLPVSRGGRLSLVSLCRRIDLAVASFSPDIVHVWLPEIVAVPAAWAARRRGIPVVSSHRARIITNIFREPGLRDQVRYLQYLLADRMVANFSIQNEPALLRWLFNSNRGLVINNGLDLDKLRGYAPLCLHLRTQYRLIYAGRVAPEKGLPIVLQAMVQLVSKGIDVGLTIFGEGMASYERRLGEIAKSQGLAQRVIFAGNCHDWPAYAGDAHAVVFPSHGEGTSNVVLEALAVGISIIIADMAMTREMLVDGENSIVVRVATAESWCASIERVVFDSELRQKLKTGGMALAEHYSIGTMVARHDALYREIREECVEKE